MAVGTVAYILGYYEDSCDGGSGTRYSFLDMSEFNVL